MLSKVSGLVSLADRMTSCAEPMLYFNEMSTVQAREPLTAKERQYRWNIYVLAKALHTQGVRVFISLPRVPLENTKTRALLALALASRRLRPPVLLLQLP